MEFLKEEIASFLSKAWVWCAYIIIGIVGKFSHDLIMGKKLTWLQVFASIGIALFTGFIASMICLHNFPDKAAYIVPISTLLSEKIIIAVFSIDYKKIASDLVAYFADKIKK